MLDLDFDQEQELLRQTARDLLARHCPLEVVRQMEDDSVGYPTTLWAQLGELDLIGLLLPEGYGGSGMSLIEGVALYEELGRALAPTPHFVSAVLSGGVLAAAGSEAQKERWLRPVASGEAVLTPAWLEPENGFSARGVQVRAVAESEGYVLSGVKRHVAYASSAERNEPRTVTRSPTACAMISTVSWSGTASWRAMGSLDQTAERRACCCTLGTDRRASPIR